MRLVLTGLKSLEIQDDNKFDTRIPGYEPAKVLCCAICRTDAKMWEQGQRDLVFPRVLGHEIVVEKEGRRYIVWPGKSCGECKYCKNQQENLCDDMQILGFHTDGGFADQVLVPVNNLIPVPDNLESHIACFAEPIACIINAFEKFIPSSNGKVLVYGGGTVGLLTGLYAKSLGLEPVIIEKSEEKINRAGNFLKTTGILCQKEINESEFDMVINACPDFIAFCQAITKIDKAGRLSFFSGISKNETIETNLINLLHYKEVQLAGAYGCKFSQMEKSIEFMSYNKKAIKLLIEQIVSPSKAPELMAQVLSGKGLKIILDFTGKYAKRDYSLEKSLYADLNTKSVYADFVDQLKDNSLCKKTILAIKPVPEQIKPQAVKKIDDKTKPLGALGYLEDLSVRMCLVQTTLAPKITQKNLFVFAADHGVTQEGVSAYPAEVTAQMVENFLNKGAAINVLCQHHGIDMKVVDIGVLKEFNDHPDLIKCKVAKGTKNFALEPAMTKREMIQALESGMSVFQTTDNKQKIDIVGLGEMGIGNTTSASAIICAITGITPKQATGRGTGVDDKGLEHKTETIEKVLAFHRPDPKNGFEVLQKIGGFEIAGIAGAILAAAQSKTAIVLDGVISTAAGLIAYTINPDIQGYLIAGHKSVEKAHMAALNHMGLIPLIDLQMRLGEGTGAALAINLADAACKIIIQMASFDDAKISRAALSNMLDKQ
jgi:nicotinate-nucleotide--dimethylbenzimidazole phosphoribosyltransferase